MSLGRSAVASPSAAASMGVGPSCATLGRVRRTEPDRRHPSCGELEGPSSTSWADCWNDPRRYFSDCGPDAGPSRPLAPGPSDRSAARWAPVPSRRLLTVWTRPSAAPSMNLYARGSSRPCRRSCAFGFEHSFVSVAPAHRRAALLDRRGRRRRIAPRAPVPRSSPLPDRPAPPSPASRGSSPGRLLQDLIVPLRQLKEDHAEHRRVGGAPTRRPRGPLPGRVGTSHRDAPGRRLHKWSKALAAQGRRAVIARAGAPHRRRTRRLRGRAQLAAAQAAENESDGTSRDRPAAGLPGLRQRRLRRTPTPARAARAPPPRRGNRS